MKVILNYSQLPNWPYSKMLEYCLKRLDKHSSLFSDAAKKLHDIDILTQ
jgi:hypothetical protein